MNTIIEKIRAEVLRLIRETDGPGSQYGFGKMSACNRILNFLDTIQEQPVDTSEDERIRQGLISYLKADMEYNPSQSPSFYTEALAYLGRQSKPKNCEGLEEETEKFIETFGWGKTKHLAEKELISATARHFYELGCRRTAEKYDEIEYKRQRAEESVPKDLEEAARRYGFEEYMRRCNGGEYGTSEDTFIAGAKWQKEQIMKEGTKKVSEDLEKLRDLTHEVRVAYERGIEVGRKEQKEQLMKEAVDVEVESFADMQSPEITVPLNPTVFKVGDKVRIIIVKED